MDDIIGNLVVIFVIIGFTYGLVKQLQHTITIHKTVGFKCNRLLIGNYLKNAALFGFIISFLLNVLVGLQIIQSNSITSDTTGFSCTLFLLGFFIAEFWVIPKRKVYEDLY
ncbi:hypothetical protein ACIQ4I_13440 [Rummeliibacillus sp. NPDC094406]|uniref:hypothetical protein n=1 Tax=Rummeliibacillus sp. NPDC094406 TaxID=3364511 RepID=UPI0037F690A0